MSAGIELEAARLALTGGGFMQRFREGYWHDEYAGSLDAPMLMPVGSLRAATAPTLDGKVYVVATELRAGWLA
jgi:hypothetical protein